MIGSARIDPVWYWSRQAGMIGAINLSHREMLHNYDEFVFSLGDVWVYEILENTALKTWTGQSIYPIKDGTCLVAGIFNRL